MPTIDTNTCTGTNTDTGTATGVCLCVCVFCFLRADLLFHLLRFGLLRFINFSTSSAHHTTTTVAATTTTTNTIHIHPLKFIVCFVSLFLSFLVFSFLHSTVLHFGVGVNNIYLPLYTINHNYDNDNNNTAALVARYRFFFFAVFIK